MSNPSWCPACEESCPDQPDGMCTTCGEELQPPPSFANNESSTTSPSRQAHHDPIAMAMLASSIQNTGIDATSILPIVNQLQSAANNTNGNQGISDIASLLPPEALNPQAGTSRHRPVSKRVLDYLKRVVLTGQSAELFDAQVSLFDARDMNDMSLSVSTVSLKLNAVPGEFGPIDNTSRKAAALVICSPRTTKGGLSLDTLNEISILRQHRMPFVAYVERGDGITFVQKALACQNAGKDTADKSGEKSLCCGVIVGNAGIAKEVWPYVMQDTKNEAETFGLYVPVVMVRRDDGQKIVQWAVKRQSTGVLQYTPCQIHVNSKEDHSCPVCAECYVAGATIVRLPTCGHVFHESCAMMWLTKHNTCPYCRKELPTEDEEYEVERRRREARDSGGGDNGAGGTSFYG
ncbi:hypothetical protein ACHAWO_001895 [Cyclotella atomus]|uniref:RING-type domain-containing protein n=1 Tax=Cyclotella atomus TaxID=382360 RepID=A0ABD3NJN5_9STRA